MEILIVGSGNMARGIGTRLIAGRHGVRFADRQPEKAVALAGELGGDTAGEALDDPGGAEIVILATPYQGSLQVAERWADRLAGTTVVDICNPVDFAGFDSLVTPPDRSAAEQIAATAPDAAVVKAFNTTFASRLAAYGALDVFIAGDDENACAKVALVCEDGGLRPILVGGLKHAGSLEGMQLLHMKVQDQIQGNWSTHLAIER
ncbi:NADPH-dependent F420 reductase [Glycomyces xiaoerkulensis]|uniref:NADPH-dependent F420 reductase n=1 Tax=Glycomyces xiaoerkulensis TaxID=2038139 RepID=UPI000C267A8A|nr:NAD(P)-binding domain-containing protein [Glycomyces xiaoerkulensis]